MTDFDQALDTSGLNCPLPILKTKKSLSALSDGQTLRVISTDPGSMKDFSAFCKQTGHELVSSFENGNKYHFLIKKISV